MDSLSTHSCVYCQRLKIDIRDENPSKSSFEVFSHEEIYGAMNNCALFKTIVEGISPTKLMSGTKVQAEISSNENKTTWSITFCVEYTSEGRSHYGSRCFFYVYTEESDPAHRFIQRLVPNLNPRSPASFETARKWLLECQRSHRNCCSHADQTMPTRLLKIPQEDGPAILGLINVKSQHSYVALSYCWGRDQPCKLTKQRLQDGGMFSTLDLPRTILDAVEVTKNLGISFIWIDALCIIQDDPESVGRELEKMPAIYSNAILTISAASAKTCYDGFLNPREALGFNSATIRLPIKLPDGEEGHIFLAYYDKWAKHQEYSENEPINERAWTLQEHVVPPRILYYSSQQLHWICRGGILAEGGFCPSEKDTPWKGRNICRIFALNQTPMEIADPSISTMLASSLSTHNEKEYDSWMRNWSSLLQDYQARRLTNSSDKLVAVSSVGILLARYMHTEFIVGLFERYLDTDMLWNRADGSGERPRPVTYRAPSWSWASIDSKTENRIVAGALRKPGDSTIEVLPWLDQQTPTARARIGLEPLELTIRGWMTTISLWMEETQRLLEVNQWRLPKDSIMCRFDAMDVELDTPLKKELLLIEANWYLTNVGRQGPREGSKVVGLIALRVEKEGEAKHRRVGYFEMQVSMFYQGSGRNLLGRRRNDTNTVRQTVRDALRAHQRTIILV
ncbi:heterokaryon incompatibility protein-domain-containing protein [Xylariaceae sp. FL1651]|nr:heterokaryon incompatibility protein-domain-containing protein [Xylariaceae sp. FL1651]